MCSPYGTGDNGARARRARSRVARQFDLLSAKWFSRLPVKIRSASLAKALRTPAIDGLPSAHGSANHRVAEKRGAGKGAINYKLRDWLFSRQGIGASHFDCVGKGNHRALEEKELPIVPPPLDGDHNWDRRTAAGVKAKEWIRYLIAHAETNTMPQGGSARYPRLRPARRSLSLAKRRTLLDGRRPPGGADACRRH